jgi:tRNA threonylcarbamoyladenosine biosynthesis protein TsaB
VLGFDTATEDTAVCATRGGKPLHEALIGLSAGGRPRHTEVLLGEVELAAESAGGWPAVGLIAVGLGPGSFTGVRIAVATARAIGASAGVPVRGVCTLDALGAALAERRAASGRLLAVLDARRGEVFSALYEPGGERVREPVVGSPGELAEEVAELGEAVLAAGSGALRFRAELVRRGVEVPDDADSIHRVSARHICGLAARQVGDAGPLAPIYLRPPDAVRWRERHDLDTGE